MFNNNVVDRAPRIELQSIPGTRRTLGIRPAGTNSDLSFIFCGNDLEFLEQTDSVELLMFDDRPGL